MSLIRPSKKMFESNDTLTELSVEDAIRVTEAGDDARAIWMMRWLMDSRLGDMRTSTAKRLLEHRSPRVRLNFIRSAASSPRERSIWRRSSLLGYAAGTLSALQREIIETIFETAWNQWNRAARHLPINAKRFTQASSPGIANKKVVVALARFIHSNPAYIESDLYRHVFGSLHGAGFQVSCFDAGDILYDARAGTPKAAPLESFAESLARFERFVADQTPDIVVTDGNFVPTERTVTPDYWSRLKKTYGFKLITIVPDSYDWAVGYIRAWSVCSDSVVPFNYPAIHHVGLANCVVLPSIPFEHTFFEPLRPKSRDFVFIGSNGRDRNLWLTALAIAGIGVAVILHDRHKANAPSPEQYAQLLGEARLIFNNGFVDENTNILTGRFFEGILSKAVVIQEDCPVADSYFVPFVHFVPVGNADEAIMFSQFLLERDDIRERIAAEALDFWYQHYRGELVWSHLWQKLSGPLPSTS